MNPGVEIRIKHNLKDLKLSAMLRELGSLLRDARENQQNHEEFLLNLTETEVNTRAENSLKRRLKEAKFPLIKPMETFDFEKALDLDANLVKMLSTCEFIEKKQNAIFLGRSGTGKTHLATALGIEACRKGFTTRFVTGCGIVNDLVEARDDKCLKRVLSRYARYDLLILDELGYVPFSVEGSQLLFQILTERHEKKSIIITSNLGFADWTQIFGDPNLTSALLDRITHRAHIIQCVWDSFRLKDSLSLKR
jgi:DNA replication protein DnaC